MSDQSPYGYQQGGGGYQAPPPPPQYSPADSGIADFLSFRKFITPVIIQIIFWIAAVITFLMGLVSLGTALSFGSGVGVLTALFTMVLGPVLVRVYCEIVIQFFRMNETLLDIKRNTQNQQPGQNQYTGQQPPY